ncbi:MAG: hypothetical protein AAFO04_04760 [Cyanobacteria bacterium J06592_8]
MKRTILLGSLLLSAGLTVTQIFSLSLNSSKSSLNKLAPNRELIVYESNNEDGEREDVKTTQSS